MIQAGGHLVTEVIERERTRQARAAIDFLDVVLRAVDADDPQIRLDRAELARECVPLLLGEITGHQDIDPYPAHHLQRFECILGAQDPMAEFTQRLIDQLLYGCIFLQHEDGRGSGGGHATTLTCEEREGQTQMGQSSTSATAVYLDNLSSRLTPVSSSRRRAGFLIRVEPGSPRDFAASGR